MNHADQHAMEQSKPNHTVRNVLIGLAAVAAIIGAVYLAFSFGRGDITVTVGDGLPEVRNDCPDCGREGVVGTWSSDINGATLVFSNDGTFTLQRGEGVLRGTFERSDDELCLVATDGSATAGYCYDYVQAVDAMKLDDVTYIRGGSGMPSGGSGNP
jgi:hypothetical protein